MLRYGHRWHDAANGPLLGEARLLWFAAPPAPIAPTPDDASQDEDTNSASEQEETESTTPETTPTKTVKENMEFQRRQARAVFLEKNEELTETRKASDVIASAVGLQESLADIDAKLDTTIQKSETKADTVRVIQANRRILVTLSKRTKSGIHLLETMHIEEWENGDMTPAAFLGHYERYIAEMKILDDMDAERTPAQRVAREGARNMLLTHARKAVELARRQQPIEMPQEGVQNAHGLNDEQVWAMITKNEKKDIIKEISEAAGLDIAKNEIQDDVDSVSATLEESGIEEMIQKLEKETLLAETNALSGTPSSKFSGESGNVWNTLMSTFNSMNDTLGIEWMTAYELYGSFKKVYEAITKLRERKSALRISQGAQLIGNVAALFPGLGGEDLVTTLSEQNQAENDEFKEAYLKELKNSRVDYGFTDLFGGNGNPSRLKQYADQGDTNRTRAILEFAAGKGLIYGLENTNWKTYALPGGLSVNEVLPKEWTNDQKETYWNNIGFSNTQGMQAQEKAGEEYARGRSTLKEYLDPFKSAVNGLSLSFAKGIANKALEKVKDGEASAMLTLIVLDAWEHNPLFRKYVPSEWLDRLAGDSKQLFIGMVKYDKEHLLGGIKSNEHNLAKAHADGKDGEQRMGPFVMAVRSYLIKKNGSLGNKNNEEELMRLTAKLIANQTVELGNGKYGTIYSPELLPYHIKYKPNEMRGADVVKLGADFFIERSEVTRGTTEVMKAIAFVRQDGFAEPEKARYYLSHIYDQYVELKKYAQQFQIKGDALQAREMKDAALNLFKKLNPQLNEWIKEALASGGGEKILNTQHKDQNKGEYIIPMLIQSGLLSQSVVEQLSQDGNKNAKLLLNKTARN